MGVGLCKEKAPEPNKRALAKQRYSKTKVSGLSQLPPPSVHESENRSKPGMSVVSRKSDLSMYYSCIPNENSLAMNNTWLENPDYEEYKEKDGSTSENLRISGHLHPQKVHEGHGHEQIRKKSQFANQETNDTTNETMHTREEMYASNKLQSITDRADSEESPRSRLQSMSEGFFEPNSFLDEELDSRQKRISIAQRTFSFGVIADDPGLDPVEEERKKRIKGIQETFGFLEFVFGQGLDGYQKIYESKDSFNKLEVKLKTVKTHKGIKVVCVHSEWFVAGSGEALVRFINSEKGMNEVLQHIGSFEEYEKITDEKGHKYTVYGMSYEVGLNTQVKGPVFIRSYKTIGEGKWRDAFRVIDGPSLIGLDGFVGTNISVGGHMITKLAGEEGKYKVRLYFETVLPEEDAELISMNLLAEKVQVYVNGFNAAASN